MHARLKLVSMLSALSMAGGMAQAATTLTATPGYPHPQSVLNFSGAGFADGEAVDVYVGLTDTLLLVASATGTLSGTVTVPAATQPGRLYVTAIGRKSGDAAQAGVTVTTPWLEQGFGAAHLGWNPYENMLGTSNASSLGVLWDAPTNGYGTTPVIDNGRVIIGTAAGLESLSTATGAVQWTSETNQGFYASPAVSGTTVYAGGYAGETTANFYAVSLTTGKQIWSTLLGSSVLSSAVVVGGTVYVGCEDDKVYALNATTGAIYWTYTTGAFIDSSPAVVNGVLYIGSTDDTVYALNASTGALIWSYKTGGPVESTPAVSNGVVYVGSDDKKVYALSAKGPNLGALLWSYTTGNGVFESPAVANNQVFIGSSDGNMYALNAYSGALQWDLTTKGVLGSAAVANGVVYFTSRDGSVYAVAATYGGILATGQTGATYLGSPVVSDGIAYLSTIGGDTFAFSAGAGANTVPARPPARAELHPNYALQVTR